MEDRNTDLRSNAADVGATGRLPDHRFCERLHTLAQIQLETIGATPLPPRAQSMAERLRSVFAMDACVMRLLDGKDLVLLASAGLPDGACPERIPVACGIASEILKRHTPLFLADIMSHPVLAAERAGQPGPPPFITYAGAPMLAGERVIGILALLSKARRDDLTQADMDCIQLMANGFSVAIANDRLYEQLLREHEKLETEIATRREAERLLAESEEEARQLREDLAKRSRISAMGELTATIAHELNQPLGAIITNAQASQRLLNSAAPDLEEIRTALADMITDALRANEVVSRVREFLQRGEMETTPLQINAIVHAVVPLLKARLAKDQVVLTTHLSPNLPPAVGCGAQLQQVILNLVINAVDAMMSIPTGTRSIDITTCRTPEGMISVAVTDSGTGIAPADLERVFDAFFTTKSDGTGMGLPICRSIVEAHGGSLWAESDGRSGSVFRFTMPTSGESTQ